MQLLLNKALTSCHYLNSVHCKTEYVEAGLRPRVPSSRAIFSCFRMACRIAT